MIQKTYLAMALLLGLLGTGVAQSAVQAGGTVVIGPASGDAGGTSPSAANFINANSVFSPTIHSVANVFASGACQTVGCQISVGAGYPFDAERFGYNGNYFPSAITSQRAHVIDNRGGGEHHVFVDPAPPALYESAHYLAVDCYAHFLQSSAPCVDVNLIQSAAGFSLGNPSNGPQGWMVTQLAHHLLLDYGSGITSGDDVSIQKNGIGDVHRYAYIYGEGGFRADSDETLEGHAQNSGESNGPAYTGTVLSITADSITVQPTKGQKMQGTGRMLINRSTVQSGCVTAMTQMVDDESAPMQVTLMTLGCGLVIPPSGIASSWGKLDDSVAVTVLPSSSPTSVTATLRTLSIHSLHGHPAVGDLGCFVGEFHEAARVTAVQVGAGTNGDDLVSYNLRMSHYADTLVVHSATGCQGLELKANTIGDPDSTNGNGLRYVLDVAGALDGHTLAVVQFTAANSYPVKPMNMQMRASTTTAPLSNAAGIVTVPINGIDYSYSYFFNQPSIYISGSDNAAFNGPCTNVTTSPTDSNLYCTQAASTGQVSTTASATVTLGDTGFGNTRVNLFSLAQVLDVQNYSGQVPQAPSQGLADTFRLEPNGMNLQVGSLVEEPHDYAAGFIGDRLSHGWFNPYASEYSDIHQGGIYGVADGNNSAWYVPNNTPASYYAGQGGTASTPRGYRLSGMYAYHGSMSSFPYPSGGAYDYVTDCTLPNGYNLCLDAHYTLSIWQAPGNNDFMRIRYTPFTNTVSHEAAHEVFPRAPTVTGAQPYFACGNAAKELVFKTTPCNVSP